MSKNKISDDDRSGNVPETDPTAAAEIPRSADLLNDLGEHMAAARNAEAPSVRLAYAAGARCLLTELAEVVRVASLNLNAIEFAITREVTP